MITGPEPMTRTDLGFSMLPTGAWGWGFASTRTSARPDWRAAPAPPRPSIEPSAPLRLSAAPTSESARTPAPPSAEPSTARCATPSPYWEARVRNSSKTLARSWGPGGPYGWYWTEMTGRLRWRSPSTLPSLRLRSLTYQLESGGRVWASSWNSWFWEVT